jgi:hypothetical protein
VRVELADIVNWVDIRGTVAFAILGGVGLSLTFGCLLLGGVQARENYNHGRVLQAAAYGAVAAIALAATAAGIVIGLIVIADK